MAMPLDFLEVEHPKIEQFAPGIIQHFVFFAKNFFKPKVVMHL